MRNNDARVRERVPRKYSVISQATQRLLLHEYTGRIAEAKNVHFSNKVERSREKEREREVYLSSDKPRF